MGTEGALSGSSPVDMFHTFLGNRGSQCVALLTYATGPQPVTEEGNNNSAMALVVGEGEEEEEEEEPKEGEFPALYQGFVTGGR